MSRTERVAAARKLRAQGLTNREIGARLGVARSTAADYLTDPDRAKIKARRSRYGTCPACGNPTDGSNGRTGAPALCQPCRAAEKHANRKWTPETVIDAIQRYAATHDGHPPAATDWQRADPENGYPASSQVYRTRKHPDNAFATWNDAIAAAGYVPRPTGHYEADPDEDRERRRRSQQRGTT